MLQMHQGLKKAAKYCDEDGKQHVRSAVCSHLGCVVSAFAPSWPASEM